MIQEALARSEGVQARAAELLGVSERGLRYKLIKYGFREETTESKDVQSVEKGTEALDPSDIS
jgi:DNA-binding NtrC family response regulator